MKFCRGALMKMKSKPTPLLVPRLRIVTGKTVAFGPGKAELLARVGETGSIGRAAKRMGMSYMRAWSLIQTMNACFKQPVIRAARGGQAHGGAQLTETGRRVLARYQHLERTTLKAAQPDWRKLQKLLRG
jgi:molybdate transport system regulatory protein